MESETGPVHWYLVDINNGKQRVERGEEVVGVECSY